MPEKDLRTYLGKKLLLLCSVFCTLSRVRHLLWAPSSRKAVFLVCLIVSTALLVPLGNRANSVHIASSHQFTHSGSTLPASHVSE